MNQQTYQEFIQQVRGNIENYKKNVIDQKYQSDVLELQSLLEDLKQQTNAFFRENQRNMTPEVIARIDSEVHEAMDYINLIASETEHFIRMDQTLSRVDADVLLAQNNFLKNLSLRDEVQVRMDYYEKASKKSYTSLLKQQDPRVVERMFTTCVNAEGRKKSIANEYAAEYQKLSDMKANLNKVLQNDRKKMQSLYNEQARKLPAKSLGEIKAPSIRPELRVLSNDEIKRRAQFLLSQVQKLDQYPGTKVKYQFTFEGKDYTVMVPLGKDPFFKRSLEELASFRDILKERMAIEQDHQQTKSSTETLFSEKYEDIKIDYEMLKGCTMQQKVSYLQTIMLRIEKISSAYTMQVEDLKGNTKTIPSYYYGVYQECIDAIWQLSLQIDPEYVNGLSDLQKVSFYEGLMRRIESITQKPFVVIDGKNISAKYAQNYISAKDALSRLSRKDVNFTMSGQGVKEYFIDESYVATLSDEHKLSYYSNLIGKSSSCPMEPKVVYSVFGVTMHIPEALVTTVQECERRMQEYMTKNDLVINEEEVNSRSPEMQFAYYGRLIEKMKLSKKGPKTKVEAFGESFEIPYECLDTFHECLKRMDELKKQFTPKPKKRFKMKKIRKPNTTKVKDFFKKLSNKTKIALAIAATAVTTSVVSFFSGYYFGQSMPKVNTNDMVHSANEQVLGNLVNQTKIDPSLSSQIDQKFSDMTIDSKDDSKIDNWVKAAKQSTASKFGSTFTLNDPIGYRSFNDMTPRTINADFANEIYTVTKIVLEIPGEGLKEFNYLNPNSQAEVDALAGQGIQVARVGGVAQKGEQDYAQHGKETAYFDIDRVNMVDYANRSTTNLSQQILEQLNQGKEMGR